MLACCSDGACEEEAAGAGAAKSARERGRRMQSVERGSEGAEYKTRVDAVSVGSGFFCLLFLFLDNSSKIKEFLEMLREIFYERGGWVRVGNNCFQFFHPLFLYYRIDR